jgi:hypothetical protein
MNPAVQVSLIGAFSALFIAVVAPLLLSWQQQRHRRQEREEDYARQDEVAEKVRLAADQAAEAAKLLLERQDQASEQSAERNRLLVEANERAADSAALTNGKLDQIHTLVNSNMTAAMQSELDATVALLDTLREVVALNEAAGRQPTAEAVGRIDAMQKKVDELSANLTDRLKQTAAANQIVSDDR